MMKSPRKGQAHVLPQVPQSLAGQGAGVDAAPDSLEPELGVRQPAHLVQVSVALPLEHRVVGHAVQDAVQVYQQLQQQPAQPHVQAEQHHSRKQLLSLHVVKLAEGRQRERVLEGLGTADEGLRAQQEPAVEEQQGKVEHVVAAGDAVVEPVEVEALDAGPAGLAVSPAALPEDEAGGTDVCHVQTVELDHLVLSNQVLYLVEGGLVAARLPAAREQVEEGALGREGVGPADAALAHEQTARGEQVEGDAQQDEAGDRGRAEFGEQQGEHDQLETDCVRDEEGLALGDGDHLIGEGRHLRELLRGQHVPDQGLEVAGGTALEHGVVEVDEPGQVPAHVLQDLVAVGLDRHLERGRALHVHRGQVELQSVQQAERPDVVPQRSHVSEQFRPVSEQQADHEAHQVVVPQGVGHSGVVPPVEHHPGRRLEQVDQGLGVLGVHRDEEGTLSVGGERHLRGRAGEDRGHGDVPSDHEVDQGRVPEAEAGPQLIRDQHEVKIVIFGELGRILVRESVFPRQGRS